MLNRIPVQRLGNAVLRAACAAAAIGLALSGPVGCEVDELEEAEEQPFDDGHDDPNDGMDPDGGMDGMDMDGMTMSSADAARQAVRDVLDA